MTPRVPGAALRFARHAALALCLLLTNAPAAQETAPASPPAGPPPQATEAAPEDTPVAPPPSPSASAVVRAVAAPVPGPEREPEEEAATDGPENRDAVARPAAAWGGLEILGATVAPGERRDLQWTAGQSFAGESIRTPVAVARGAQPGPTLCLTAAIHGDELNGVEIVRRTMHDVDVEELSGTLIGVPIVNMLGFSRGSRYLPDRRDLNRYFPGRPDGSSAARIAYLLFSNVIEHCDFLVDFHTGSFKRTNLPQLRADLGTPAVREFVGQFGATAVLHKRGARGTLRRAATEAGIPAATLELGEPGTLQLNFVSVGVRAIETLLDKLEMLPRFHLWLEPQPVFYRSHWLRAYRGGILTSRAKVGRGVREGELLGTVINPVTNERSEIRSPYDGRLLGRALNQFVLPGFATFHIGIATDPEAPVPREDPAADGIAALDADDDDPDGDDPDGAAPDEEGGAAETLPTLLDVEEDPLEDELH